MDIHNIILDCDWFVLGQDRLIKQLAFYDTKNQVSFLYVFRFPQRLKRYAPYFDRQSRSSHRIPWNKNGFFHLGELCCVLQTIKYVVDSENIKFWAKGTEKASILSRHGITVNNLEDIGCPRFDQLTCIRPKTMNKARVFATWFMFTREQFMDDSSSDDSRMTS